MNLATIIDAHPEGQVALVSHGRETTYGELRTATAALRAEFAALGVGPGHVVALLCSSVTRLAIVASARECRFSVSSGGFGVAAFDASHDLFERIPQPRVFNYQPVTLGGNLRLQLADAVPEFVAP